MELSQFWEMHLINNLNESFKLGLPTTNHVKTINELYSYLGITNVEEFTNFISNKGYTCTKWLKKNRHVGPQYKGYKLLGSAVAMSSDPPAYSALMGLFASELIKRFGDNKPDYVVGLAQGGIPMASCVSLISGVPLLVSRLLSKSHYDIPNMIKLYEPDDEFGEYFICCESNKKVWIIDDEITSGKAMSSFINSFEDNGIQVEKIGIVYEVIFNGEPIGRKRVKENTKKDLVSLMPLELPVLEVMK